MNAEFKKPHPHDYPKLSCWLTNRIVFGQVLTFMFYTISCCLFVFWLIAWNAISATSRDGGGVNWVIEEESVWVVVRPLSPKRQFDVGRFFGRRTVRISPGGYYSRQRRKAITAACKTLVSFYHCESAWSYCCLELSETLSFISSHWHEISI